MANVYSSRRSRARFVRHVTLPALALAILAPAAGCMQPSRPALDGDDRARFRTLALQFIAQAAFGDDPVLRMQAIEAVQEVAAHDAPACILDNIDNGYAGVSFAALMAVGRTKLTTSRRGESGTELARLSEYPGSRGVERGASAGTSANADSARTLGRIRILAEDTDANVRIAALYALHQLGDSGRTRELSDYLLRNPDARVRANAALAIGLLADRSSIRLLHQALKREKKDAVKMQILEALASMGDSDGTERLKFCGYSAVPDQAALALMCLANARSADAEEIFRIRLQNADYPEIRLQAARGLGRLGLEDGMETAVANLAFRSPVKGRQNDPPEQQIARVRALAALALESIGNPDAIGALWAAFNEPGQAPYVRLAVARAAIRLIDSDAASRRPARTVGRVAGAAAAD